MIPPHMEKASPADLAKAQIYKSITRNFYLHKSFDIQLDLEFLPALPEDKTPVLRHMAPQGLPSPLVRYNDVKTRSFGPGGTPVLRKRLPEQGYNRVR